MKNQGAQFDPPPKVVKPRTTKYRRHPVVAVCKESDMWVSEHGETGTMRQLVDWLPSWEPTLLVASNAADLLGYLDNRYLMRYPTRWQRRTSTHERAICRPDGVRVAARITLVVHYLGWKNGNYHKAIDPITMYGHKLDTIWPGEGDRVIRLLRWGIAIRNFCHENGIDVRPTTGGISAQFLTDRRFYPKPRRKVPATTNQSIRTGLPGNYYHLTVRPRPDTEFTAHYLDQSRAHHFHAATTPLPDADHLYAIGDFRNLEHVVFSNVWDSFYGLYCVDLEHDGIRRRPFSWLNGKRLTQRFIYSNELSHLRDMGYRVTGVRAAWGSTHRDTGLSQYAKWASSQLDRYESPAWLKPLLLSAYGVLATSPKHAESIFRLAKSGEPVMMETGHYRISGLLTVGRKKLEPRIANVLHRGMIEAATRSESVGLAQWLDCTGYRVLSIYADAVIVMADEEKPLPELPPPWRNKRTLNHLQFINQQAFISGEMTKLPGVSRDIRDYRQHSSKAPRTWITYEALSGRQIVNRIGQVRNGNKRKAA